MKLLIVVATQDNRVDGYLRAKLTGAIPVNVRKLFEDQKVTLVIKSFLSNDGTCKSLPGLLTVSGHPPDGVVLICETSFVANTVEMSDAVFIASFQSLGGTGNVQNLLSSVLARVLKNFNVFRHHFDDAKFQKIILLPLKNFAAKELADLRGIFAQSAAESEFANLLDQHISRLNQRRTPKTDGKYQQVYLRDDKGYYFEYGKEIHKQVETSEPPHQAKCWLNSNFRFGLRYAPRRHFNISLGRDGARISGIFMNCHDEAIQVSPSTHLNMFPNGFF